MSDQRIQYDEEMVGAGHPTKDDTLNRLSLEDHASDGSHFYKGFISGMAPKCTADGTTLKIGPGAVESGGKIYKLEAEASKTATTSSSSSLGWYCVYIDSLPSSGRSLSASNLATGDLTNVARSGTDGLLYKSSTKRVIGLYPTMSSEVKAFYTSNGRYQLASRRLLLDDSTPPTTATSLNAGLPALSEPTEALVHTVSLFLSTGATLPSITLYFNSESKLNIRWPYANGTSSHLRADVNIFDPAYDGTLDFHAAVSGGTLGTFQLYLSNTTIPHGLAQAA